jgi:hypothetical protein
MSLNAYKSQGYQSGTVTAGSAASDIKTLASLTDGEINGVVKIQVPSGEDTGVEVIAANGSTGFLIDAGSSDTFPCDDLGTIQLKRRGSVDCSVRFYAF